MKTIKPIFFTLIINFCLLSCAQEKSKNSKEKKNNNKTEIIMKNILIQQLKSGKYNGGDEFESYEYTEKDLIATFEIISNELVSQGYKNISAIEFNEKIKKIFGRIIDNSSPSKYISVDFYEKCNRTPVFTRLAIYNNIFIVKDRGFITNLYAIPELIKYEKLFPNLVTIENEKIHRNEPDLGNQIEIPHWKDIPDLDQQRKRNIQTLVARNMYLFNDNRAYFRWLVLNDEYFMRSLVTTFGYYEDNELNKWVANNTEFTNKNIEEVNKVLYNKKCDGKIKVNYPLLELISEDEKKANEMYDFFKLDYFNWLQDDKNNLELTFSQKAEIIARLQSFIFSNKEEYRTYEYMGKFAEYYDRNNEYSKEFKQKNYYSISAFEKQWKEAKTDGDGMARPGEE